MIIEIVEEVVGEITYNQMNCNKANCALPGCGGCNCYRFTYKDGAIDEYFQGSGCMQTGIGLFAATTKAECDAKIAELELDPVTPEELEFEGVINSGGSKSFQFPFEVGGSYDLNVLTKEKTAKAYEGDPIHITQWDHENTNLSFEKSDVLYNFKITGITDGWRFNNGGDKLKLYEILSWGALKPGNSGGNFYGCENLELDKVSDILNLIDQTTLYRFFRDNKIQTTIKYLRYWYTTNIINMSFFARGNYKFNDPGITYLDVQNVSDWYAGFSLCELLNQDFSRWNNKMANATDLRAMYNGTPIDQNFGGWIIPNVTTMANFLLNGALSTPNYNDTLIGFAGQSVQPNVPFHAGGSKYSAGAPAEAKAVLEGEGWDIDDGGQE